MSDKDQRIHEEAFETEQELQKLEKSYAIYDRNKQNPLDKMIANLNRHHHAVREKLEFSITLKEAIQSWLREQEKFLSFEQRLSSMTELIKRKIVPEYFANGKELTVGGFKYINHSGVINYIRQLKEISERRKVMMIDCYTSLLAYLNKISCGWFKEEVKALKLKISPKMIDSSLSFAEWRTFIDFLSSINHRDELIAYCIMQGARRISEVLKLKKEQVDFDAHVIHFTTKKEKTSVNYEPCFMKELAQYIEDTKAIRKKSQYVFVTKTGKPVTRARLNYVFGEASKKAGLKKISPESLRALWVIFKRQNFSDYEIMEGANTRKKYLEENEKADKE